MRPEISRRSFVALSLQLAAVTGLPKSAVALTRAGDVASRSLVFHNLHTGERLSTIYWESGRYLQHALTEINLVLRDHYSGEVAPIDRRLLELLNRLQRNLGSACVFEVISGYRSPATNALLASMSQGVAHNSLHMKGMAIDIRVPGAGLSVLRDTAISLKGGGVGYYPQSQFVHVDVGRIRYW